MCLTMLDVVYSEDRAEVSRYEAVPRPIMLCPGLQSTPKDRSRSRYGPGDTIDMDSPRRVSVIIAASKSRGVYATAQLVVR